MKRSWLAGLAVFVALAVAYPYLGWAIYQVVGTNTVAYVEYDGRPRTMVVGPAAPLPDWLPVMPWSLTLSASSWPLEPETGSLDALVHAGTEDVVQFYRDRLSRAGFDVEQPAAARTEDGLLGVTGTLLARRDATQVRVLVRSRESLVNPARVVQVNWYPKP